jgi:hypothetical protein
MTDPIECDGRNRAMTALLADANARHQEIVAETELNRDYSLSPIVLGDPNSFLAAGYRLPDMIPIYLSDAQPSQLHKLAQRAGHTLMLLAGPAADAPASPCFTGCAITREKPVHRPQTQGTFLQGTFLQA